MANFIRADAHFHPKINSLNAQGRSFAILQNCVRYGINALVCNDHVYDNPMESFTIFYRMQQQFLNQYPQFKNTFLFPGIEYLCMEGAEIIMFHDEVDANGNTIIYRIREAQNLLHRPFFYTFLDVIHIAKRYGFAIFAPHPCILGSTGGVKALGKTREGRLRVAQIVQNRHIGMELHNGSFDAIRNILKVARMKVPMFENITSTPQYLLDDALPKFFAGGADAHSLESMGSGIQIPFSLELTRENVYNAVVTNRSKEIFRPKGFFGYSRALGGLLKSVGIVAKELITEAKIAKELVKEKLEILEAYTRGWELGLDIEELIKIKGLFPGNSILLQLSKSQRERIINAMQRRKKVKELALAEKTGLV